MNYSSFFISILFSFPLCASAIVKKERTQAEIDEIIHRMEPRPGGSVVSFIIQRISPTIGLYLLGEDHDYNHRCQKGNLLIMQRLCKILRDADEDPNNTDRFHILLEARKHPSDYDFCMDFLNDTNYFFTLQKYRETVEDEVIEVRGAMHYGLLDLQEKRAFKQTIIENCDIRKISAGILRIIQFFRLNGDAEQMRAHKKLQKWFRDSYDCDLLTVTFQDLINEFDSLYAQGKSYRDSWENPKLKEELQKDLNEAEKFFKDMRSFILESHKKAESKVQTLPNEAVFDYCERVAEDHKYLEYLLVRINWSFSYLIDCHLFHRILTLRKDNNVNKIIYNGGADHGESSFVHFQWAEDRKWVARHTSDESFTRDDLVDIESPLDEIEHKYSPWYAKLYNSMCILLTRYAED